MGVLGTGRPAINNGADVGRLLQLMKNYFCTPADILYSEFQIASLISDDTCDTIIFLVFIPEMDYI